MRKKKCEKYACGVTETEAIRWRQKKKDEEEARREEGMHQ